MKKKIFIGIILVSIFTMSNIKAASVNDGSQSATGHWHQTLIDDNGKSFTYYCIDKGVHSPKTSDQIVGVYKINNPEVIQIYNQYNRDYDKLEYALRQWAVRSGATKQSASAEIEHNYSDVKKFVDSLSISPMSTSLINGSGFSFIATNKVQSGLNVTITYQISSSDESVFSKIISWEVITNGWKVVSQSADHKTITLSGGIKECEGAELTLRARTNGTTTPGSAGNQIIPILLPGKNAQGGVVFTESQLVIPYIKAGSTGSGNYILTTVEIPDDECKCTGSTDLKVMCDQGKDSGITQNYYVKDSEEIKKCIISGYYKNYCGNGNSIKKTTDNNAFNHTQVSQHSGKNVSEKLGNNKYCAVYCTEEIEYDFPGVINTKAGTYFKLSDGMTNNEKFKIKGKRTCYTSRIKKESYIEDVRAKQQEIINLYNYYNQALAYQESLNECGAAEVTSCTNGLKNQSWYTCPDKTYNVYRIASFDTNTGAVSYTSSTTTVNATHGTKVSDGGCTAYNKNSKGQATTCKEYACDVTQKVQEDLTPNFASVEAALKQLDDLIEQYKSCFEWTNNYCFDPKVEFSYDEPYEMGGELKGIVSGGNTSTDKYFTTDPGAKYDAGAYNGTYTTVAASYIMPREGKNNMGTQSVSLNTSSQYISKEVIKTKEFENSTKKVYTYHPYGTIFVDDNNCGGNKGNCIDLGYVFPVALEHENTNTKSEGIHKYSLDISNLGVPGDDATCKTDGNDRLMGNDCSLYNTEMEGNISSEKEYVCLYKTEQCPECDVDCSCDGVPGCIKEVTPDKTVCKYVVCPECIVTCVGCLWNNGDATFAWKQVALSDVFPNKENTKVGYNWNTDANVNPKSEKAEETLKEIEEASNKVYEEAQYSYTLTPSVMAEIRKYNDDANKGNKKNIPTGGYSNNTLTCKDGKECKSSFLDFLEKETKATNKRNKDWHVFEKDGSAWK